MGGHGLFYISYCWLCKYWLIGIVAVKREGDTMNLGMNLFKKRKKNNSGFSLIEILLAIAILAIVIGPIFSAFITSAKVNMNARKTMAATNVAQTILEGFADKRYSDISSAIGNMGSVDLTGTSALSSVNDNYYNMQDHCGMMTVTNLSANSADRITVNSLTYDSTDLISGNGTRFLLVHINNGVDTVSINSMVAADAKAGMVTYDKELLHWTAGDLISGLVYTDIEMEGYHFDVVVTFLPMAQSDSDRYYSYCVTVSVYDADSGKDEDGDGAVDRLQDEVLMNTMIGGLAK